MVMLMQGCCWVFQGSDCIVVLRGPESVLARSPGSECGVWRAGQPKNA